MGRRPDDLAIIDWKDYNGDTAVFPVCMKSPAVNGRPLRAQLKAAAQSIDNLIVVICDSLNRFNSSSANGLDHSTDQGTQWLETNLNTIKEFFPEVQVLRWERDIRSHPSFERYLKTVQDLYKTSSRYRKLRDSMSAYYLESKYQRFEADYKNGLATAFDVEEAIQSSADYLDEEFAGDMVYYDLTGGLPHIYWGLYVDDHQIFSRESGLNLPFPQTLPVTSKRLGSSIAASDIANTTIQDITSKLPIAA